jgi:hypothetical protein
MRPRHDADEGPQPLDELLVQVVGKPGDDQAPDEGVRLRHAEASAVEMGPRSPLRGEQLVAEGIEHRAGHHLSIHRQGHRRAEEGVGVGEVGRPVEGLGGALREIEE